MANQAKPLIRRKSRAKAYLSLFVFVAIVGTFGAAYRYRLVAPVGNTIGTPQAAQPVANQDQRVVVTADPTQVAGNVDRIGADDVRPTKVSHHRHLRVVAQAEPVVHRVRQRTNRYADADSLTALMVKTCRATRNDEPNRNCDR